MNEAEITGLSIVCLAGVLVAGLTTVLDKVLRWAGRAVPEVFVEDCTMLHDCDGDCGECGEPMVVDEQAEAGIDLAYYGRRVVHRQCLTARRDNGTPCASCLRILAGAS